MRQEGLEDVGAALWGLDLVSTPHLEQAVTK